MHLIHGAQAERVAGGVVAGERAGRQFQSLQGEILLQNLMAAREESLLLVITGGRWRHLRSMKLVAFFETKPNLSSKAGSG